MLHRQVAVAATAVLLAVGLGAAFAVPGGAQVEIDNQAHLVVDKVVVGTQPEGTQFTVQLSCSQNGGLPTISQVVMNGPGNVADAAYGLDGPVVCTITEPATGGATASFGCSATGNAQCNGNVVTFNTGGDSGTITVTNTFADPVVVSPAEVVAEVAVPVVAVPRTAG